MPGYIVRAAIFRGRHGDVYYPSGHDAGSKKRGRPTVPPPPYRAPKEQTWTVSSFAQARKLARELNLEHGDKIAIPIEPVDPAPAAPRPKQTSLAELGDWPRGWPQNRWTRLE